MSPGLERLRRYARELATDPFRTVTEADVYRDLLGKAGDVAPGRERQALAATWETTEEELAALLRDVGCDA